MKYQIGLDIGASKILGIVWDGQKIIKSIKIKTPKNKKELLASLFKLTSMLFKTNSQENIFSIGIAVAGVLDKNGKILISPNLKFLNNLNLKDLISKKFKRPTKIINDARAFLLYELKLGMASQYKNIVALTIGSGIGGGFSIKNKLVDGCHNSAGEVGHMIIQGIGNQRSKIKNLSLENLASVKNLRVGYTQMGQYLGIGLANLVNILDPEIIVIGGGLASVDHKILIPAKRVMKKLILSPQAKQIPIIIEKNFETANAIGATLI
ncbi:ROK family protein [Candidatus Azambacteria bacterium]|nr:ROK family protein [Candidatus Azambacteria bacterium]